MEIWSRRFFFFFFPFNLYGAHTSNITKPGANDSECSIWIFWVCWLSPTWYTVDCSQVLSQFSCYHVQLVYPTMEHRQTRSHSQETSQNALDTFNQSQHLFYTLQKSFVFHLHFYLSWNNKAYYDKNVAFSHPSSILKWLYRNPPTLLMFFNACWHDSYHNIIFKNCFEWSLK